MSEPSEHSPTLDFDALPPVVRGSTRAAEWWIALSHLRSRKRDGFVNVVTLLSVIGVLVGVAQLNMVLSVMTGFELDLRDKILGANAHVVVLRYGGGIPDVEEALETIEAIDGVEAASPFVYSELMVRSAWSSGGVIVKGIDPVRTGKVTALLDDLTHDMSGELTTPEQRALVFAHMAEPFAPSSDDSEGKPLRGIILGKELREQLQVRPGDVVQLINPLGGGRGPMGMPVPQVRPLRVAAVYDSGMYEYDTKWTYVANDVAASFLKMGDKVTGIEVRLKDLDEAEFVAEQIEAELPYPHFARHWKELNEALFKALKLEKVVMGLILFLVVVVAALLIITTLTMLVITKGREIAILKAMGAGSPMIRRIFMIEGAVIGLVGTGLGTVLGLLGCLVMRRIDWKLETDVYYLDTLPVVIEPWTVASIAAGAVLLCFVATLYPASRAAAVDPVEGLRYE